MESNIIQKRYRFNLDTSIPEEKALADYLEVLDSLTVRERGAWLTRALVFYHDAIISGVAGSKDKSEAHHALMAQTLAFRNGYTPEQQIGIVEESPLGSIGNHLQTAAERIPVKSAHETEAKGKAGSVPGDESDEKTESLKESIGQGVEDSESKKKEDSPLKRALSQTM